MGFNNIEELNSRASNTFEFSSTRHNEVFQNLTAENRATIIEAVVNNPKVNEIIASGLDFEK